MLETSMCASPDAHNRTIMVTAFVLSGGGSLGAVQAGMLLSLFEAGVTPDMVVGTSVGAFNGGVGSRPTRCRRNQGSNRCVALIVQTGRVSHTPECQRALHLRATPTLRIW